MKEVQEKKESKRMKRKKQAKENRLDKIKEHDFKEDNSLEQETLLRDVIFEEENSRNNMKRRIPTKDKTPKQKQMKKDVFILLILVIIFFFLLLTLPKIYIIKEKNLKIDYGSTYDDQDVMAKYLGKNYTHKLKRKGKVDTTKIGTYEIKYTLDIGIFHAEKVRKVEVVDRKKPEIKLTGNNSVSICPNGSYQEEGVTAFDEYDGDLTDKIERKEEKDKIIYTVKDNSGNEREIIRKIERVDNENPKITLKGGETIYVEPNGVYKEPGYTVSDNCDVSLEDKVKITGNVDTTRLGKYTLTYEVEDSFKNKITATRTVIVTKRTDPESGVLKKGAIYLTFDDGPNSGTTDKILDILKEEGVHATFFVTTNGPDELIKRAYDEGHSIALHTATHNYSYIYQSEENYFEDLKRVSDRVKRITGIETKLIRFPGGSSNTVSKHYNTGIMTRLTNEVLDQGYRYYDWNVDASDAWLCTKNSVTNKAQCVYDNVTKNLYKSRGNVVLMHDVKAHTRDALRDIIRYGKENGYTFETIDMNTKMVRFKVNN